MRQPHQNTINTNYIAFNSYLDGVHSGGGGGDHLVEARKGGLIQAKRVVELAEHLLAGHLNGERKRQGMLGRNVMKE